MGSTQIRTNPGEYEVARALSLSASTANDYFTAATDIVFIYEQVNSPSDRTRLRPYVNKRLDDYSRFVEHLIKAVNQELSRTSSAGIAATGTRLRDELRDGQSLLKASEMKK